MTHSSKQKMMPTAGDSASIARLYDEIVRFDRTKGGAALANVPGFAALALWISLGCFVLSAVLVAVHARYFGSALVGLAALASLLAGYVALGTGLLVVSSRALLPGLRHPLRTILKGVPRAEADFELAERLSRYDEGSLRFLAQRLRGDAQAVRLRARLWAGAVETLGILPALAGALFAAALLAPRLAHHTLPVPSRLLALGSVCLAAVYVWGMTLLPASGRIEELAGVVEFALAARRAKRSGDGNPALD